MTKEAVVFDLKKHNPAKLAEAGYTFEVETEAGVKTGIKLTVRGSSSPVVKAHARKVYQEQKIREQQAKRRGKELETDLDEADDTMAEFAAKRLIGWEGLVEDGKEVKYSEAEAYRIMREYDFLRVQVLDESDNVLNFSKS